MTYSVQVDENLIALTWFGLPSLEGVKELERAFERVAISQRRKIAFATRIHAQATPERAPAEVRAAVAALLRRFAGRLCATVIIYEAPGFKATALRMIIATINLLSRSRFPSEVQSKRDKAVAWMVQQLGADAPDDAERRLLAMLPAQVSTSAGVELRP